MLRVEPISSDDPGPSEWLFAYGTLLDGGPPEILGTLRKHARRLGPASVAGRLYDSGAWPALRPAKEPADRVPGVLFEVFGPLQLWPVLDAWEGCGNHDPRPHLFERERLDAVAPNGRVVRAWAYVFAGDVTDFTRIDRWMAEGDDATTGS